MTSKTRFLNYGLKVMTVSHILTHVFGGIHTAIFGLLRDEFNLTLQQLGIIAAIPPLIDALIAIPTGLITDSIGSRKMLLASFAFTAVGALLAGFSNGPVVLVVAICLIYINTTIYHPASYSYTTRIFSKGDRSTALGLHGAGGTLGHAMGPLAVSILVGVLAWGWRQVYLALAAPMIIGVFMVLRLREDQSMPDSQASEVSGKGGKFLTPSLVIFLLYSALRSMGGSMIGTFLVIYLLDVRSMTIAAAGLLSSATTLTGLIAAPIGGVVAARIGDKRWLEVSLFIALILMGLSFNSPSNTLFTLFYIAYGFFGTLGMAARSSIMASLTPREQRGLGYSLFFLPGSIVGAIAPIVAGTLAQSMGYLTLFNLALLINFIALAFLRFAVKIE